MVKAIINIMLISVFKKEAARKTGDFTVHCVMDEIGKLHPSNIQGLVKMANELGILLINGSPFTQDYSYYNRVYKLMKDKESQTRVKLVCSHKQYA